MEISSYRPSHSVTLNWLPQLISRLSLWLTIHPKTHLLLRPQFLCGISISRRILGYAVFLWEENEGEGGSLSCQQSAITINNSIISNPDLHIVGQFVNCRFHCYHGATVWKEWGLKRLLQHLKSNLALSFEHWLIRPSRNLGLHSSFQSLKYNSISVSDLTKDFCDLNELEI